MPEYVRAKDKSNGVETSIPASWLDTEPDAWEVVKKDATSADGTPLPPKIPAPLEELPKKTPGKTPPSE